MTKLRKVVFFDESIEFLKDLKNGGKLVNVIMKQVFTGSRTENLALAMDLLNGKKKLDVRISTQEDSSQNVKQEHKTIKVNIKKEGEEKRVRPNGKKVSLLDDLSDMAKDFGE